MVAVGYFNNCILLIVFSGVYSLRDRQFWGVRFAHAVGDVGRDGDGTLKLPPLGICWFISAGYNNRWILWPLDILTVGSWCSLTFIHDEIMRYEVYVSLTPSEMRVGMGMAMRI